MKQLLEMLINDVETNKDQDKNDIIDYYSKQIDKFYDENMAIILESECIGMNTYPSEIIKGFKGWMKKNEENEDDLGMYDLVESACMILDNIADMIEGE